MSVTTQDIYKVAHLARITISEKEVPRYVENMNNLLRLVEQMNRVDTTDITPMAHPLTDQQQRLRPDKITETNQRDLFQQTAPAVAEGLYLVPIVIEE